MDVNNYFSHTSPTYGSPFDMMRSFGVKYSYAGENIASGQRTPQEVMTAWMNSAGHRANILNGNFTKIGVGYVNGEWVQMFIG
ncbi:Cysteine-rich secretory protein family protein [compost metagenome]